MPAGNSALNAINNAVYKLKDCTQGLEALSSTTEDQFLDIGARLASFYERASKVSGLSGTVVDHMSGGDINGTIEGLTSLMGAFEVHLNNFDAIIGQNITKLNSVSARMDDVEWHLEDMDRITRALSALGLNIRVQNAILKKPVEGIRVLGGDVKKLSSEITEKTDHIGKDARALSGIVYGSRLRIDQLSAVRKKDTADIIKSTTSNILHLKEKYAHAAKSAEDISLRSGEISQCIQEIVVVIQFHDIMRQRFEHARAAFGSMAEILEAVSGREDLSGTADDLLMFCVHEGAPLYRTREDFVSTVLSVIDNLRVLSSSVNSLLGEVKSLVHAGSSMEGSFLDTIDRSLAAVNSTVNAFYAGGMTKGELSAATSVVVNTLAEISGFIKAIEYIGDEIELIAFNAAVKADQIGEEGRALGVVADEIQSISAVAQVHTSSIAGILKDVGSYAEELSLEVGEGERAYMLKIEETSRKLSGFTGFLTDLNKELITLISSIEETGKGLVDEIDGIIGSISIHEDVELVIEAVISNLREIFSETTGMFPAVSRTSRADVTKSFDQLLEVEVKRLKAERKTGAAATAPQEFGENVELFS